MKKMHSMESGEALAPRIMDSSQGPVEVFNWTSPPQGNPQGSAAPSPLRPSVSDPTVHGLDSHCYPK